MIEIPQMPWEAVPVIGGPPGPPGPASEVPGPEGPEGKASEVPGPEGPEGKTGPAGGNFGGIVASSNTWVGVKKLTEAVQTLYEYTVTEEGEYLLLGRMVWFPEGKGEEGESEKTVKPRLQIRAEGKAATVIAPMFKTKKGGELLGWQVTGMVAVGKKLLFQAYVETAEEQAANMELQKGVGRSEFQIVRVG